MSRARIALCLSGGGVTGAMYQIGALAALEDVVSGLESSAFDVYVGVASGASVTAALAGGASVQRLYRTFLDPADDYFPLQRSHLLRMDMDEWRRTIVTAWSALRQGTSSLLKRGPAPTPNDLWEQLDRFYDSLPAGLFTLDAYEHLLEDFFLRRSIPNSFRAMPRVLRIPAYDLDSAERVVFGSPGHEDVPVSRACAASMALPLFYSPVRIGERHYIDGSVGAVAHLDVAQAEGAEIIVVVNPMVPFATRGSVPTGHGRGGSIRDKGMMWVYNQAIRLAASGHLEARLEKMGAARDNVVVLSPRANDAALFLHNPASFVSRRQMLEYAYKSTRDRLGELLRARPALLERAGWTLRGAAS